MKTNLKQIKSQVLEEPREDRSCRGGQKLCSGSQRSLVAGLTLRRGSAHAQMDCSSTFLLRAQLLSLSELYLSVWTEHS